MKLIQGDKGGKHFTSVNTVLGPSFIIKIFQGLKVLAFKEKKIRKMEHVCLFAQRKANFSDKGKL